MSKFKLDAPVTKSNNYDWVDEANSKIKIVPKPAPVKRKASPPLNALPKRNKREETCGLWTERYRPTSLNGCVGNSKAKDDIVKWIQKHNKPCLINGPVGCGKNSIAVAVLKQCGYAICDIRNIPDNFSETLDNIVSRVQTQKMGIIVDEVESLSPTEKKQLSRVLKSKNMSVPIIIICDSIYERGMDAYVKQCQSIRMFPPYEKDVITLINQTCRQEGVFLDDNQKRKIALIAKHDLRKAVLLCQLCSNKRLGTESCDSDLFLVSAVDALNTVTRRGPMTYEHCMAVCHGQEDGVNMLIFENYPYRTTDTSVLADAASSYDILNSHERHNTHTIANEYLAWSCQTNFSKTSDVKLSRAALYENLNKKKKMRDVCNRNMVKFSVSAVELCYVSKIVENDSEVRAALLATDDKEELKLVRDDLKTIKNRFNV